MVGGRILVQADAARCRIENCIHSLSCNTRTPSLHHKQTLPNSRDPKIHASHQDRISDTFISSTQVTELYARIALS